MTMPQTIWANENGYYCDNRNNSYIFEYTRINQPSDARRARAYELPDGNFYNLKVEGAYEALYVDSYGNGTWKPKPEGKWQIKYIREDVAQKPAAAVDLEALKQAKDGSHYNKGWNACIVYLHAQGMLTQPKGRE